MKGKKAAPKTEKPSKRPVRRREPARQESSAEPVSDQPSIQSLQRDLGNRGVQRLIQSQVLSRQGTRRAGGEQTLEQAETILADCKRDLHYRQVKLALASPKGSLQRKMMTFLIDWRYGFTDYWAKISPMNKRQWEIYQGFGQIKSTMTKYEDQVRAQAKDPRWKTDTRAERAVAILKRYRFRFKRNPYSGLWTVWDKWGDVHFRHITNDQLLKVSKRMVRWARAKRIAPVQEQHTCGLTKTNVDNDYQDLKSVKKATTRWVEDLKAARAICRQIIATFRPKDGTFKARNGWELKVLAEVTINKDTRFVHILRSYTKARNRADAVAAYIGLQPFYHSKSGSLEGDPKDPGISREDRQKILRALGF